MTRTRLFTSKIKLAGALGISKTTLQIWEGQGLRLGSRPYDLMTLTKWLITNRSVVDGDMQERKLAAQVRKIELDGDLQQVKLKQTRGGVIPVSIVEDMLFNLGQRIQHVRGTIARKLGLEGRPGAVVSVELAKEVDELICVAMETALDPAMERIYSEASDFYNTEAPKIVKELDDAGKTNR